MRPDVRMISHSLHDAGSEGRGGGGMGSTHLATIVCRVIDQRRTNMQRQREQQPAPRIAHEHERTLPDIEHVQLREAAFRHVGVTLLAPQDDERRVLEV